MLRSLISRLLPPLPCFGRLGACPPYAAPRFHVTCLWCRWRRARFTAYEPPPWYWKYVYRSLSSTRHVPASAVLIGGRCVPLRPGTLIPVTTYRSASIDPRGPWTAARVAAIRVLDALMLRLHWGKPLVEACEFLANYPT